MQKWYLQPRYLVLGAIILTIVMYAVCQDEGDQYKNSAQYKANKKLMEENTFIGKVIGWAYYSSTEKQLTTEGELYYDYFFQNEGQRIFSSAHVATFAYAAAQDTAGADRTSRLIIQGGTTSSLDHDVLIIIALGEGGVRHIGVFDKSEFSRLEKLWKDDWLEDTFEHKFETTAGLHKRLALGQRIRIPGFKQQGPVKMVASYFICLNDEKVPFLDN